MYKSLDIFEMTINTNEPSIVLVNNELLIFKHYEVDVKDIKCPLQLWENMKACFLQLIFLLNKSLE
jgi:hypothetical protein